jgi:hypothetical protein
MHANTDVHEHANANEAAGDVVATKIGKPMTMNRHLVYCSYIVKGTVSAIFESI